jgi:hypothetical protein
VLLLLPLCADAGRTDAELGLANDDDKAGLELLLLFDDADSGVTGAAAAAA